MKLYYIEILRKIIIYENWFCKFKWFYSNYIIIMLNYGVNFYGIMRKCI